MKARVWQPDGSIGPGELVTLDLTDARVVANGLTLPCVTVRDARGDVLFGGEDLCFDPSRGGEPLASPVDRAQAHGFGVVNAAYHVQRGLAYAINRLGAPLPPLLVKIGMHAEQRPGWSGGHYRLPARTYSTLPESDRPLSSGEIHLGSGGRYIPHHDDMYWNAPAHNPAIIYHELGHHICRHTADFRANAQLPSDQQENRKMPLDEGTCDYFTAVMLGIPDIFGWHRGNTPRSSQKRRHLDAPWTMGVFHGGHTDPHIDGTIWSAALWSTRMALEAQGVAGDVLDRLVLQALTRIGKMGAHRPRRELLRSRRRYASALQALLAADRDAGGRHGDTIERTFAKRGIIVGLGNREMRERCRRLSRQRANG